MGAAALPWIAGVGAASSAYQGHRAREQQRDAQRDAQRNAQAAATEADEARNRANQRKPDTSAILASARRSGQTGLMSTLLTGPGGVDPDSLRLGRNSLLGG